MQALEFEKSTIITRLDALRAGKAKKVTAKEREDVEREWKTLTSMAKKREGIAREMWKFIEDQLPDKEMREQLREAFDLDG